MSKEKVILLRESWIDSAKRDITSAAIAFMLIGLGNYIGSAAMEWFGFLICVIVLYARASGLRKKYERTLEDAIAEIKAMIDGSE